MRVKTIKGCRQSILCLEGTQLNSRLTETRVRVSGEGRYLHVAAAACWGQHLAQVETKILYLRRSKGDRCGAGCKGRRVIRSFLPHDSFPLRLPGPPPCTSLPSLVRNGVLWCLLITFEDLSLPPCFFLVLSLFCLFTSSVKVRQTR